MIDAGALHAAKAIDTGNPKKPFESKRVVGTPDAIHLMSCVYARDVMKVSDVTFHSTDEGRG
jgi:hypothetical protein